MPKTQEEALAWALDRIYAAAPKDPLTPCEDCANIGCDCCANCGGVNSRAEGAQYWATKEATTPVPEPPEEENCDQ